MRWNPNEILQIDSSQNIDKLYIMNDDHDSKDSLRDIFVKNSSEDEIVRSTTNNFKKQEQL